jgi:uncharacterized SAM-binding protein YcdF (DUF218 family)
MVLVTLGLAGGLVFWGEFVHWRASRRLLGCGGGPDGPEAVVVLGYRNTNPSRANALNRWRVRVALRSADVSGESRLVFCGGSASSGVAPEALLMARYAVEECGFRGSAELEDRSRTTWENVENALPFLEDAARIKIVSNPLHSLKARIYLHRMRPDLAQRLVRADDYRVGEWALLKPVFAAYGLWDLRGATRLLRESG